MPFDGTDFRLPEIRQMLIDGREKLNHGWIQKCMRSSAGVCMVGSLSYRDYHNYETATRFLLMAIEELGYGPAKLLSTWQDHPERTKDEVLEVYDRAIARSLNGVTINDNMHEMQG